MQTKFKVGDIVKYTDTDPAGYPDKVCQKYFKIIAIDYNTFHDIMFTLKNIDSRLNIHKEYKFFHYRFGIDIQEYIVLKLKGIVK